MAVFSSAFRTGEGTTGPLPLVIDLVRGAVDNVAGWTAGVRETGRRAEEALRIRREEVLPVYEKKVNVRSLIVGRTNLAINLYRRGFAGDRPEIDRLLGLALAEAERLQLPEPKAIRQWQTQIFGYG